MTQRYDDLRQARLNLEEMIEDLESIQKNMIQDGELSPVPLNADLLFAKTLLALLDHMGIPKPIVNHDDGD